MPKRVFQLITLTGIFLGSYSGLLNCGTGPYLAVGHGQTEKDDISAVTCKVSTSDLQWPLRNKALTISVELEFQGKTDVVVLPSVQLTALPKQANELEQVQYWAPFDLDSGASTNQWQRMINGDAARRRTVSLVPAKLSWALTKSSVWPSRTFPDVVAPGRYALQVKFDTRDNKIKASNEVTITVLE